MPSPISFLKDELKQKGVATYAPELVKHEAVVAEVGYALSPILHEGKLKPYGFIVIGDEDVSVGKRICDQTHVCLAEARKVADGCYSFSIFKNGQFGGVLILEQAAQNELQLIQLQQDLKTVICITDTSGVTKIFCDAGVLIHQYRSWQRKPSVTSALQSICRCVPQAHFEILRDLLEFCFHELSPRKIGATLVWCLVEPRGEELENMRPSFTLERIEAKVGDEGSVAVLRHLLTYTDGAAILDAEARTVGVGAQLKYSEESKQLIEARAGTRHTSAQRFSYDFAKAVVFVVSSDGPVTVFSDGMSVTDLKTYFTDNIAAENVEDSAPEQGFSSCMDELNCPRCKKKLKIHQDEIFKENAEAENLFCPICGHLIFSTRCANLNVYVVKDLETSKILVNMSDFSR